MRMRQFTTPLSAPGDSVPTLLLLLLALLLLLSLLLLLLLLLLARDMMAVTGGCGVSLSPSRWCRTPLSGCRMAVLHPDSLHPDGLHVDYLLALLGMPAWSLAQGQLALG